MKLLVGLGNPGEKYAKNRHNVGFMFLDAFGGEIVWRDEKKFFGTIAEMEMNGEKCVLLKPDTFMNDSGKAVAAIANFYKINVSDVFVIHDDLDIGFGAWKIQQGRGPKVHNGITSIEQSVGSADFWRVRIGVDGRDPQNRTEGHAYVLQDFTNEEVERLGSQFFIDIEAELKKLV
jgi:PTH1 family peptidyl-tRNA hydrolase